MSAIGFDTLKFARKLKEAGVPEKQAEAQAEILGEAFLFNLDEIVTRDYLDPRLESLEARLGARIDGLDARLDSIEERFDARLNGIDTRLDGIDARLDSIESRLDGIDGRLNTIDQRFIKIDGQFRLMYWMLGMIIVVNAIPILTGVFG